MNREFEYYRVSRKNDDTIPLLDPDNKCPDYFYEEGRVENPKLMMFKLGYPIPRKPKMVDYHSSPNSVISKKIFDVLEPKNIEGIQLLPSVIRGKNDELFDNYWAIHIFKNIKCVDDKLSDCIVKSIRLSSVKKLVLDKKILESIPLNERLVFRLEEDFAYQLFHVSIVESIMAVNPDGIRFTNIEEWHEGSYFDV